MSDEQDPKGPPSPRGEQQQDAASGKHQTGRVLAQHFWEELQKGATHYQEQGSEVVPRGRVRQFIHGLSLPFHIARALLGDPVARRQYLRVGLMQTVVALALALTCMGSAKQAADVVEDSQDKAASAELSKALEKVATAVAEQKVRKADREVARELRKQRRQNREAPAAPSTNEDSQAQAEPPEETDEDSPPPQDAEAETKPSEQAADAHAAPNEDPEADAKPSSERAANAHATPDEDPEADTGALARPVEEHEPAAQEKKADVAPSAAGASDETKDPRAPSEVATDAEGRIALNLEQRVRDIEAAANNPDSGTEVSDAVLALVVEAISSASSDASSVKPKKIRGTRADNAPSEADKPESAPLEADKPESAPSKSTPQAPREGGWLSRLKINGYSVFGISFWVALFAAMQLAQWVVIALSRDYHDVISREASLLTRVEPEDDAMTPYIRLNVSWMRKKVHRRIRAMILFAVGVPAAAFLVSPLFCLGLSSPVLTVITSLWGGWWLMVFTAAKSAQAWEPLAGQRPPWFLRAWTWMTTRMPGLRWRVLQRYGEMWSRRTTEVFVPVSTVERHPWAYAGLALVRFVGSFAPLKFFVRPLIPVASAHILREEHARRVREGQGTHSGSSPRVPGPLEESIRA
ncbi:hypothetical protein HUW62_27480 [Myxococcus sp. AM011]|uniref:hypothetical protein n=1 Tax=Myxococcus sp. AM011 TaxID=2745200 RepID=UPI001595A18D|nr:hypothetical protein [Myxococcus sp. AM011]NVJ24974.1 hypothetical protein [Myxococcus sp. AM011]